MQPVVSRQIEPYNPCEHSHHGWNILCLHSAFGMRTVVGLVIRNFLRQADEPGYSHGDEQGEETG